jgi:hypothetical protein
MQIRVDTNIKNFKKKINIFERDLMQSATPRAINKTLEKLKGYQTLLTKRYLDRPTRKTQNGFFIKYASKRLPIGSLNMKDFVEDYLRYQVKWGSKSYKAQPEKIIPAKDAYTVRNKTIQVKRLEDDEERN